MKIVFYLKKEHSISILYSKDVMNKECGFGGAHTALIEMTSKLAEFGHEIIVYGGDRNYLDYGVKYVAHENIEVIDWSNVDWFCTSFHLYDLIYINQGVLNYINNKRTKVLIWTHTFVNNDYLEYFKNRFDTYVQVVSEYVFRNFIDILDKNKLWIVPNGISSEIFNKPEINNTEKRGNWIFHSTYERGGEVALKIFRKINNINNEIANKINYVSYWLPDKSICSELNENEAYLGSKSKIELRQLLLKSDYFVYPLVLKNTDVNHDTFGMAILEALACGVIVVVWNVACIPTLYGDLVIRIDVPDKVRNTYNPQARYAKCEWMLSEEAEQLFINKILEIENNLEKKEEIRSKGIEWAQQFKWEINAKKMEHELLTH